MKQPGAELDDELRVAMGWTRSTDVYAEWYDGDKCPRTGSTTGGHPSEKIEQAIALAEEMRKAGRIAWWQIESPWQQDYARARVHTSTSIKTGQADTLPHALTLALLSALKGDV